MGKFEPTVVQRVSPARITGLWEKIVWLHSVMASIAILITIMVLELRIPHGADMAAHGRGAESDLCYELRLSGDLLEQSSPPTSHRGKGRWAHSLGQFSPAVLTLADPGGDRLDGRKPSGSTAHRSLWRRAVDACDRLLPPAEGNHTQTRHALRAGPSAWQRIKGKISPLLYLVGVVLAFVVPWLSIAIYVLVAVIWLIPDRRIERRCGKSNVESKRSSRSSDRGRTVVGSRDWL
jgi:hypothetical protein